MAGTVTEVKRPGKLKGKGEIYLRFDSLTFPNGITRDFRARLGGSDAGDFDREEGKIRGEGDKAGDARRMAETTAAGAGVDLLPEQPPVTQAWEQVSALQPELRSVLLPCSYPAAPISSCRKEPRSKWSSIAA